ncbi:META domain-containing protein [Psychroserpens damuponensis]|uniref:META domain-containing protein n=1 Tax=Psychroserpens damuponensis TaxID=943936 RepID=UPI00069347AF|nr:META domain-containing protein [Psychroserpens damuponensis]
MKIQITMLSIFMMTFMSCNTDKKKNSDQTNDETETKYKASHISEEILIENTKWVITALKGVEITNPEINDKAIHFILQPDGNRVNGFSGCNTFMGNYTITEGNRISFSKMASTRMMCPDASINETAVLQVFELADNYSIKGGVLSLNKGKRAPLAVFKAVYSQ